MVCIAQSLAQKGLKTAITGHAYNLSFLLDVKGFPMVFHIVGVNGGFYPFFLSFL